MKRFTPLTYGVLSICAIAVAGMLYTTHAQAERSAVRTVATAPVSAGAGTTEISMMGTLEAAEETIISAKTQGYVTEIAADVGDTVGHGALLARLDTEMQSTLLSNTHILKNALEKTRDALAATYTAQEKQTETQRALLEGGENTQSTTTQLRTLATAGTIHATQVNSLIHEVLAVRNGVPRNDLVFSRYLSSRNSSTKNEAENRAAVYQNAYTALMAHMNTTLLADNQSKSAVDTALSLLSTAHHAGIHTLRDIDAVLENTDPVDGIITRGQIDGFHARTIALGTAFETNAADIAKAKNQIATIDATTAVVRNEFSLKDAEIASEDARIQAQSAEIALQMKHAYVTSPYSARIAEKYISTGTLVQPGTPLFRIISDGTQKIVVQLPDTLCGKVAPRTEWNVEYSDGTKERARVVRVSPSVNPTTKTCAAEAVIAHVPAHIVVGSHVQVLLPQQTHAGIRVPKSAIVARYGKTYVYTVTNGIATKVFVEVHTETDTEVIVSGLDSDATVITNPSPLLRSGDAVVVAQHHDAKN